MGADRGSVGPRRSRSPGRLFVTVGVSLFLMADHIFRNRRGLPALIVKAPTSTAPRFQLPEPLAPPQGVQPHAGRSSPTVTDRT